MIPKDANLYTCDPWKWAVMLGMSVQTGKLLHVITLLGCLHHHNRSCSYNYSTVIRSNMATVSFSI